MSLLEVTQVKGGRETNHVLRKIRLATNDQRFAVWEARSGQEQAPVLWLARGLQPFSIRDWAIHCGTAILVIAWVTRRLPQVKAVRGRTMAPSSEAVNVVVVGGGNPGCRIPEFARETIRRVRGVDPQFAHRASFSQGSSLAKSRTWATVRNRPLKTASQPIELVRPMLTQANHDSLPRKEARSMHVAFAAVVENLQRNATQKTQPDQQGGLSCEGSITIVSMKTLSTLSQPR